MTALFIVNIRRRFDNSKRMFHLKEKWYGNFNSLTLVTPSRWLAEQVEKSFLSLQDFGYK